MYSSVIILVQIYMVQIPVGLGYVSLCTVLNVF